MFLEVPSFDKIRARAAVSPDHSGSSRADGCTPRADTRALTSLDPLHHLAGRIGQFLQTVVGCAHGVYGSAVDDARRPDGVEYFLARVRRTSAMKSSLVATRRLCVSSVASREHVPRRKERAGAAPRSLFTGQDSGISLRWRWAQTELPPRSSLSGEEERLPAPSCRSISPAAVQRRRFRTLRCAMPTPLLSGPHGKNAQPSDRAGRVPRVATCTCMPAGYAADSGKRPQT